MDPLSQNATEYQGQLRSLLEAIDLTSRVQIVLMLQLYEQMQLTVQSLE